MILLVTGSRALADRPESREWGRDVVRDALAVLPTDALVVTGDAEGPDAWALAEGAASGRIVRVYVVNGSLTLFGGAGAETLPNWDTNGAAARLPWSRRPLARNAAMVRWCAAQPDARCLALLAPWARTHGTAHTIGLARRAGIAVDVREWSR